MTLAPRTGGDIPGRVEISFMRRANNRINSIQDEEDQREVSMIRTVIDSTVPFSWISLALSLLDEAGFLSAPSDAQIDDEVQTAWNRILKSRT
jgi:hypothetical protein